MKMILVVTSILIAGYFLWRWFAPGPTEHNAVAPAPAQHSAAKSTTAARPTPPKRVAQQGVAKPTPAHPVTAERRLAPEGTYFLVERASLPIESGVIGFAPGTKVTLLDQSDSGSTVTDGQYQFTVQSSYLTNDLDIAASVARSDYTAQARIAEQIGKSIQEYDQQQRDTLVASEKEKTQKKTRPRAASRAPSPARHK
jgi:hypothetical protein